MIKYALVGNSVVLQMAIHEHLGYHLLLGQHLLTDRSYVLLARQARMLGHFLIVDNGAAEADTPPFAEIVRVANDVGADEIVMPDAYRDSEATMELVTREDLWTLVEHRRRMFVPQGATWEQWRTCLYFGLSQRKFATIGIPKHLEALQGGRYRALTILEEVLQDRITQFNIHMLGLGTPNPLSEIMAWTDHPLWPQIRGLDSAAPVAWAQNDARLENEGQPRNGDAGRGLGHGRWTETGDAGAGWGRDGDRGPRL